MDNRQFFLDLMDEANCANVELLPGRSARAAGLRQSDRSRGAAAHQLSITAMLKQRIEVMRTMADNTDGIAVVEQQRSRHRDEAHLRRSDVLLSARLLLDQLQTRRPFPLAEGEGQAAGRRRAGAARLPSRHCSRGQRRPSRGGRSGARGDPRGQRGDRSAGTRPDRRAASGSTRSRSAGAKPTLWVAGELQSAAPDGQTTLPRAARPTFRVDRRSASSTARVTLKPGERTFLATAAARLRRPRARSASGHA